MRNRTGCLHYALRITRYALAIHLLTTSPMTLATGPFRLAHLPRAARVAISLFVIVLGSGYLSALVNLYVTYEGRHVLTQVIDRGPTLPGRDFDITKALANRLDLHGTQTIQWRFAK